MCGIIGIISTNGNVSRMLRESLKRLEYRGYDSAGIATIANGIIFVKKDKGKIDEIHRMLNFDSLPGNIGIGHTRWATHGQPSRENAHPHLDCSGMIAVVHNGIIENYLELREELSKLGHTFRSETDTEVIPHLIEEFLKSNKSLEEAVRQALLKVKGSFAIAVISSKEPDKIICARKESPLLIGIGNSQMFCASDIPAILPYTRNIIVLDDMEMAVLTPNSVTIRRIDTGEIVNKDIIQVSWSPEEAEKGGFPHFMLKEIHEQPRAIRDTLRVDEKALEIFVQKILT
ncbi:MAG: glutamine--fructose-6-phosphate transaminase (isomerizing), partial [Candidatus Baldrarchaeia archaeon]